MATYHRTEQDEYETGGHGNFGQIAQHEGVGQADESRHWFLQKVHLSDQHVGRFGSGRDLLQERRVALQASFSVSLLRHC